jgi:hypothetical protein
MCSWSAEAADIRMQHGGGLGGVYLDASPHAIRVLDA